MSEAGILRLTGQPRFLGCQHCSAKICELKCQRACLARIDSAGRGGRLPGDSSAQITVVLDGLVGLCTFLDDGRRQIVRLAGQNDVLMPYTPVDGMEYWLEALSPSEVCCLDMRTDGGAGEPVAFDAEIWHFMQRQVAEITLHIVTLGRLDGMERVCLFLTDMAWRFGVETPAGWLVRLPLGREDIADYLGLNTETVSRILSRVKKAKLVTFLSPSDYLVKDIATLQGRSPVRSAFEPAAGADSFAGGSFDEGGA